MLNAWFRASKKDIPAAQSDRRAVTARVRYTPVMMSIVFEELYL